MTSTNKIVIDSSDVSKLNDVMQEVANSTATSSNNIDELNSTLNRSAKSVGELTAKKRDLEALFEQAEFGTQSYNQLERELRDVNTQLKIIDERTSDTTFADRVEGLARFGQAAAGAFGLATAGASLFGDELGLSAEQAEKAELKFLQVLTVIQSIQAISEAFSIQNKLFNTLIGQTTLLGKGLNLARAAWQGFGLAAKSAIAATGIGLLLVALVTIVENFDAIKASVGSFGDEFKAVFAGITEALFATGRLIKSVFTFDLTAAKKEIKEFFGNVSDATNREREEIKVKRQTEEIIKLSELKLAQLNRELKISQAKGKESIDQKKAILDAELKLEQDRLSLLSESSDAYKEQLIKVKDAEIAIEVFAAETQKKIDDKRAEEIKARNETRKQEIANFLQSLNASAEDIKRIQNLAIVDLKAASKEIAAIINQTSSSLSTTLAIENNIAGNQLLIDSNKAVAESQFETAKTRINAINEVRLLEQQNLNATEEINLKRIQSEADAATAIIEARMKVLKGNKNRVEEFAALEKTKSDIESAFAQKVRIEQEKNADQRIKIDKDANAEINKVQEESFQSTVNGLNEIAQNVTATLTTFVDARLNAIKANIDNINAQIEESTAKRDRINDELDALNEQASATTDTIAELTAKQLELNGKLSDAVKSNNQTQINSILAQKKSIEDKLESEKSANAVVSAQKAQLLEQQKAEEENIKRLEAQRAQELENQKNAEREKARLARLSALAQSGVAIANLASSSALKDPTFGIATIAAITALAAILAATITPLFTEGFAEGGYTGNGSGKPDSSGYKPAGIVHEGEYVVPKRIVDNPKYADILGYLEKSRKGYANGGFVTSAPSQSVQVSNTNTINDAILNSINQLANRPVVVSVEEINKVQDNVTKINVLSTL